MDAKDIFGKDIFEFDFSKLSQKSVEEIAWYALHFIKNPEKGIGESLLGVIIRLVPLSCVRLAVVDNIENPTKIFLTFKKDEYYSGWHCPDGYYYFGETDEALVKRVIKEELKVGVKKFKFTGNRYNSPPDRQGHTIADIVLLELEADPTMHPDEGRWFDVNNLPYTLLKSHIKFLKDTFGWQEPKLPDYLKRSQ